MSRDNVVKLMQAAAEDEQLKAKLQNARSYEELRKVSQEQGFELGDLTAEQAQRTIDVVTGQVTEELTEEELELVAGGITLGSVVGRGCFAGAGSTILTGLKKAAQ